MATRIVSTVIVNNTLWITSFVIHVQVCRVTKVKTLDYWIEGDMAYNLGQYGSFFSFETGYLFILSLAVRKVPALPQFLLTAMLSNFWNFCHHERIVSFC